MYAKSVETKITVIGKACAYDFIYGVWVSPYGNGVTVDIYFTLRKRRAGIQQYWKKLVLSFRDSQAGIITLNLINNSSFMSEYLAPDTVYFPEYIFEKSVLSRVSR